MMIVIGEGTGVPPPTCTGPQLILGTSIPILKTPVSKPSFNRGRWLLLSALIYATL